MNTLLFLGLGGLEIMFILLMVLMLFGAKSLPDIARTLGKIIREVKNATGEIQREINQGMSEPMQQKRKTVYEEPGPVHTPEKQAPKITPANHLAQPEPDTPSPTEETDSKDNISS